jgi:malonyl CoA-acyl carrier protein transacylase
LFFFPRTRISILKWECIFIKNEIVLQNAVDQCAAFLLNEIPTDIREILYPEVVTAETEAKLKDTQFTQPALFVTEYAAQL